MQLDFPCSWPEARPEIIRTATVPPRGIVAGQVRSGSAGGIRRDRFRFAQRDVGARPLTRRFVATLSRRRARVDSTAECRCHFHQRPHHAAGAASLAVRLGRDANDGPAISRWTHGLARDELLQELRGRDRPTPAAADVLDVGHVALDVLAVSSNIGSCQTSSPHGLGRCENRVAPGLVVRRSAPATSSPRATTQAPVSVARSIDLRQRRDRPHNSSTSASTSRPSASVLCTSIVLPLRAVSTSPSLYDVAAQHVFDKTHEAHHVHRQLQPGDRLHRRQHGRRPGHVALHRQHAVRRLERQAAAVERHPFADDAERRASGPAPR